TLLMSVLWMLAGWTWLRYKSEPPELAIVIDRSASMQTVDVEEAEGAGGGDATAPRTRWQRAVDVFDRLGTRRRRALLESYQLRWYTLAETLEPVEVDLADEAARPLEGIVPDGDQSRLGEGLLRLVERQSGAG